MKKEKFSEFRRFKIITNDDKKLDRFYEIIEEKNLSRHELFLIITCLGVNFDIFPEFEKEFSWVLQMKIKKVGELCKIGLQK